MERYLASFQAYDVRGKIKDIGDDGMYRICAGFCQLLAEESDTRLLVIGFDARAESERFARIAHKSAIDNGFAVLWLGLSGTEEMYFWVSHAQASGGVCITASHNPLEYTGVKFARANSAPVGAGTGLDKVKQYAQKITPPLLDDLPSASPMDKGAYITHIIGMANIAPSDSALRVLCNAGNGAAGPALDLVQAHLRTILPNIEFINIHHDPDPTFPSGIPNPMLFKNQAITQNAVRAHQADIGVAFDGDFDRCFVFDKNGDFVEGGYMLALLVQAFLMKDNSHFVYDARMIYPADSVLPKLSMRTLAKTGHSNVKTAMRSTGAIYGGEMSAHHYYRDFFYCDSGMVTWLFILKLMLQNAKPLHTLLANFYAKSQASGEINFYIDNAKNAIDTLNHQFAGERLDLDGLFVEFDTWRFNVRASNTEPLLRLNVETKSIDAQGIDARTATLVQLLQDLGAVLA